jgi:hypothetical protein
MSAMDTAVRVLRWAREGGQGDPPEGDLYDTGALATPDPLLSTEIAALAATTAARLRVGRHDGPAERVSAGVGVAAAAVGGRRFPGVEELLRAVPAAREAVGLAGYHGLAEPVLRWAHTGAAQHPRLLADLRACSPLTGVLDHPGPNGSQASLELLADPKPVPGLHRAAALAMAEPGGPPERWLWRGEVLGTLRRRREAFVLDVYECARRWHAPAHDEEIQRASRSFGFPTRMDIVAPVARYWRPLADLNAARPAAIKRRAGLTELRPVLVLVTQFRAAEERCR